MRIPRGFRSRVRAIARSTGPLVRSKIVQTDASETLGAAAQTAFALITADDDPDDAIFFTDLNGTNITEIESDSRVVSGHLHLSLSHANGGTRFTIIVQKQPDGTAQSTLSATNWHSSSDVQAARDFTANLIYKNQFVVPADSLRTDVNIKFSRRALRRLGRMRDGDGISLRIFNHHATVDGSLNKCWGTIYSRRN